MAPCPGLKPSLSASSCLPLTPVFLHISDGLLFSLLFWSTIPLLLCCLRLFQCVFDFEALLSLVCWAIIELYSLNIHQLKFTNKDLGSSDFDVCLFKKTPNNVVTSQTDEVYCSGSRPVVYDHENNRALRHPGPERSF